MSIKTWSRRKKLTAGITALSLLLVLGVAIALLLLRAPLHGGGRVVAQPELRYLAANVAEDGTLNAQCSASVSADGKSATVNFGDVVTGSIGRCRVMFTIARAHTNEVMRVQTVKWSTLTTETLNTPCGDTIAAIPTGTPVQVDFVVPADAPLGDFTADEANAGITAVDAASFNPGNCP